MPSKARSKKLPKIQGTSGFVLIPLTDEDPSISRVTRNGVLIGYILANTSGYSYCMQSDSGCKKSLPNVFHGHYTKQDGALAALVVEAQTIRLSLNQAFAEI